MYYLFFYLHPRSIKSLFSLILKLLTHGVGIRHPFNPPKEGIFEPKSPIALATYK
jgi:hypothetical protein